jgi:hypothetical protein
MFQHKKSKTNNLIRVWERVFLLGLPVRPHEKDEAGSRNTPGLVGYLLLADVGILAI